MRLTRFLKEENYIQKGLDIPEPEVAEVYSAEEVKEYISILKDAIKAQKQEDDSEAQKAILKDLEDKLTKWGNVDTETEPAGPSVPAIDILAAQPPEDTAGEEPPPEKDKKKKKKDEEE